MPRYEAFNESMLGTSSRSRESGIPVDRGDLLAKSLKRRRRINYAGLPKGAQPLTTPARDIGLLLAESIARNDPDMVHAITPDAVDRVYAEAAAKTDQVKAFAGVINFRIQSLTEPQA